MADDFELLLFSTSTSMVRAAVDAGVDGIVVDWERRGKELRQADADTQINEDTPDDLRRLRGATSAPIVCRINGVGASTVDEVAVAIASGATEILVPMVRSPKEIETVLRLADGRCGVGMLVETVAAVEGARWFSDLPLSRVYVGLNDLSIERRSRSIFEAVIDGTVERVREAFAVRFGFGGLTVADGGRPIPCSLLAAEMARLDCQFTFLRRSFHRDIVGRSMPDEVRLMRQLVVKARSRPAPLVAHARQTLQSTVEATA